MPLWGPYSKKYFGISKILSHDKEEGVRFDFSVLPCVANTDCKAPNVTIPVGVHPWECRSDYSYFAYRQELEQKDVIYADVSFTRADEGVTLVRTEIFNNSPLMQNCLVNFFSAVQFPTVNRIELTLPEKCDFIKALDYKTYDYATPRPWDKETMDAMKKGEFFDDRFYLHRGLGDRDGNRYILPKFSRLGEEKGDRITYDIDVKNSYDDAVLVIRYFAVSDSTPSFTVNGKTLEFRPYENTAYFPLGKIAEGNLPLELVSLGTGGIEFDFLCITERKDTDGIICLTVKNNFVPEIKSEDCEKGKKITLSYEGVKENFILRTFSDDTRLRTLESGCIEDALSPRLSQPDPSFDRLTETFSGEFRDKHSDEGFYQNTLVHTVFINPGESRVIYAVLSDRETDYLTAQEYEKIYLDAKNGTEKFTLTKDGKKYEFSNELLRAAMFFNTVYPLYCHGRYVVHHTPGKRWDSFYTWDSGFIGLDMAMFCPEIAEYILDMYLSDRDNPDYAFLLHGSPVPVHIYQYYEMLCRANDKTRLYGYYDRAKMFYEFLSGKIYGSATDKFKSRLTTTFDYFYNCSGMDDLPSQVECYRRNLQLRTAPCISSSQVIRTAKLLSAVAKRLGLDGDVREYSEDIKRLTQALNKYSWDEEAGYFSYVVHDEDGNPSEKLRSENGENMNKTMDGIYPLIAGITDSNQTEKILSHLKNGKEMLSPVGISAVDMSAGYFRTNGYWNGNVWFSHQWFVWKTMLDLGESDFAYRIAEIALDSWKKEVEYSYYTFEMMSVTTGRGGWFHNFGGLSAPVNLWAAAYFKAGTVNGGFDIFCERQSFNDEFTSFEGEFEHLCRRDSTLIAVMSDEIPDGKRYEAVINGEKAEIRMRNTSACEVKIPAQTESFSLKIQLV